MMNDHNHSFHESNITFNTNLFATPLVIPSHTKTHHPSSSSFLHCLLNKITSIPDREHLNREHLEHLDRESIWTGQASKTYSKVVANIAEYLGSRHKSI